MDIFTLDLHRFATISCQSHNKKKYITHYLLCAFMHMFIIFHASNNQGWWAHLIHIQTGKLSNLPLNF